MAASKERWWRVYTVGWWRGKGDKHSEWDIYKCKERVCSIKTIEIRLIQPLACVCVLSIYHESVLYLPLLRFLPKQINVPLKKMSVPPICPARILFHNPPASNTPTYLQILACGLAEEKDTSKGIKPRSWLFMMAVAGHRRSWGWLKIVLVFREEGCGCVIVRWRKRKVGRLMDIC